MNNTAKAIRLLLECCGDMTAKVISERSGINVRVVQRALKDIRLSNDTYVVNDTYVATHTSQVSTRNTTHTSFSEPEKEATHYTENNKYIPQPQYELEVQSEPQPKSKAARKLAGCDRFYNLYPKKVDPGDVERAWPRAVERAGSAEIIIEALERQLPELSKKEKKFIKNPATWLNKKCWLNEVDIQVNGATTEEDEFRGII